MRKIFLVGIMLAVLCPCAYGAVSEDTSVYVRKDVFEVYMQNINSNFEKISARLDRIDSNLMDITKTLATLSERLEGTKAELSEKIDGVDKKLSARIDSVEQKLTEKIDGVDKKLSARIDSVEQKLTEKIDGVDKKLSARIDGLEQNLSARIDGLEARMADFHNYFYWIIVLLGIILVLPMVQKFFQWREGRKETSKQSLTIEDVEKVFKRLMEEQLKKERNYGI